MMTTPHSTGRENIGSDKEPPAFPAAAWFAAGPEVSVFGAAGPGEADFAGESCFAGTGPPAIGRVFVVPGEVGEM